MAEKPCSVSGCDGTARTRGMCQAHYVRWQATGDPGSPTVRRWKPAGPCAVDGCDRPRRASGFCATHYARWRKYGDAGPAEIEVRDPSRVCAVADCDRTVDALGYCDKHYQRLRETGAADTPLPEHGHQWTGDDATYGAVHLRLRDAYGPAKLRECQHCGLPADHWAYDHRDPHARTEPRRRLPYSVNLDHYIALCKTCHRRMDAERTRTDVCSVPGCGGPHKARGMCNRHYRRALQEERRGEAGSECP